MEEESAPSLSGIFTEALMFEDEAQQTAFLEKACGDNEALLTEVRELLESHAVTSGTFSRPFAMIPELAAGRDEEDPWIDLPRKFGNYVLEEIIGQGGMGVIYRATQTQLNRVVALKMIRNAHLATRKEIKRFYAEAQSAARLSHHGVVPIIETGEVEEQHFFSMGFVDGINLAEAVKTKTLSQEQTLFVIQGVVEALAYTHREGVIHRDLKPENILLSANAEDSAARDFYQPHISDFGLAKSLHQSNDLTVAGEIFGTPAYMSPEQASGGNSEVTKATDIYSVGALMFFALTGKPPFKGKSVWAILKQVESAEPPRLTQVKPSIPIDLETICLKCLAKRPTQRYATADLLLEDLENYRAKRPLLAKRANPAVKFVKLCQRHPTMTVASTLISLFLAAIVFLPKWFLPSTITNSSQQPVFQEARTELNRAMQLAAEGNQSGALQSFITTADLAGKSRDKQTERLARYSIDSLSKELWTLHPTSITTPGKVTDLQLSPNGKSLAMTTESGGLRVITLRNRQWELDETFPAPVTALAFHPNNQHLVTTCANGTIHIWKRNGDFFIMDGELNLKLDGGIRTPPYPHSIGFSSGGETMFTASTDSRIALWNFNDRKLIPQFLTHDQELVQVAMAPDTDTLVAFGAEGSIYGWNAITGQRRFGPVALTPDITYGAVDSNADYVFVTSKSIGTPRVYDIRSCNRQTSLLRNFTRLKPGDRKTIGKFSSTSNTLLSLHPEKTLHFHKSGLLREKSFPLRFQTQVSHFALTNDESTLCTLHPEIQTIRIWQPPKTWNNNLEMPPSITGQMISKGTKRPLVIPGRNRLSIFPPLFEQISAANHDFPPQLVPLGGQPSVGLYHQGKNQFYVLIQNSPPLLVCVDSKKGEILWTVDHPHEGPVEMALSPDGKTIAIVETGLWNTRKNNLTVVNLDTRLVNTFQVEARELRTLAFSSLGPTSLLISSDRKGLVWYDWQIDSITRERPHAGNLVNSIDVSPEKGLVITGSSNRIARVFREQDWQTISPPVRHYTQVKTVRFARGGELAISGGGSDSVKIWETTSGLAIGSALRHDSVITTINVCEESQSIITGTADGEVKFWPLPRKDERDLKSITSSLEKVFPAIF